MTDLLLLAERVEGASGPDRELDCRIWSALNDAVPFDVAARVVPDFTQWQAAHFTASLDAGLTLVPEGWTTALYQQDKGWAATLKKGFCTSYTDVVFNERGPNGHPATPALALCAAALRARHTMEGLS